MNTRHFTKSLVVIIALSLNPSGLRHRPPTPQNTRPKVMQRYAGVLLFNAPEIAAETNMGLRC